MNSPPRMPPRPSGVALLIVLALLAIVGVLLSNGAQRHVAQLRAQRLGHTRAQAQWLADSAVRRAAARLESDADYRGETWRVDADQLPGGAAGEVKIEVKPATGEATAAFEITAMADLPPGERRSVRITKRVTYTLAADSADPSSDPSPENPDDN